LERNTPPQSAGALRAKRAVAHPWCRPRPRIGRSLKSLRASPSAGRTLLDLRANRRTSCVTMRASPRW
jgi:hypothetical protein